ncbi:MAG: DUF2085 domain-containing protein [Chloroflexota bacterium]|nr:DUF2085 domain-containing protein [Chloroflexota bacterium]
MREAAGIERPSAADVMEEVKRRQQEESGRHADRTRRLVIAADRFIFWLSKHWLAAFNTMALLYAGLPFLAPTLIQLGAEGAASLIYTIYGPLCHQLPQRSWFLFGPQLSYRLPELMELAGESVSGPWARDFVGNPAVGYKVAFCQRDAAIYGAIFLFGVVYGLLRRRWAVRPLPWWAYILLGLVPMGLDGGYQFLSYALPLVFPGISLKPYETTPLMRLITGVLFGWATVWLAYPYLQESMEDVRASLERRFGWT